MKQHKTGSIAFRCDAHAVKFLGRYGQPPSIQAREDVESFAVLLALAALDVTGLLTVEQACILCEAVGPDFHPFQMLDLSRILRSCVTNATGLGYTPGETTLLMSKLQRLTPLEAYALLARVRTYHARDWADSVADVADVISRIFGCKEQS